MKEKYYFEEIDQKSWPMAQSFYYYTQMAPTSYSVTVSMDVTNMRLALKEAGYKFFPAYLYLVTKTITAHKEFRVGIQDDKPGYWNELIPAYPQFHEDDHTTSLLWTEVDTFSKFLESYENDTKQYGNDHGIITGKGIPPKNVYVISCIPWFSFQSFSLHNHGMKDYFFPSFEAGKFVEENGKIMMPLSVTVHHATTDGYHLKVFFEDLQEKMNHPEKWIK